VAARHVLVADDADLDRAAVFGADHHGHHSGERKVDVAHHAAGFVKHGFDVQGDLLATRENARAVRLAQQREQLVDSPVVDLAHGAARSKAPATKARWVTRADRSPGFALPTIGVLSL